MTIVNISKHGRGAVDITTGYGATSFLKPSRFVEPWQRECFVRIFDTGINHREFYYPLPTFESLKEDNVKELPEFLRTLRENGQILPERKTAADLNPLPNKFLAERFLEFDSWARDPANRSTLLGFVRFYRTTGIRKQHKSRIKSDVLDYTSSFWRSHKNPARLASHLGITNAKLKYTFDSAIRGVVYDQILEPQGITYFPHPVRLRPFSTRSSSRQQFRKKWSWGRALSRLILQERLKSNPAYIAERFARIRNEILTAKASWYDLQDANFAEYRDAITSVASKAGLPANVKEDVCFWAEKTLEGASIITKVALPESPLVSVTLAMGAFNLGWSSIRVPGTFARLKFLRGLLTWPGLFDEDEGKRRAD